MRAARITVAFAFVVTVTVTAAAAVAQEGAPPTASQMAKFEPLVGNWQGSGTVRPTPDAPEMAWTSTSTAEFVLGGHFVMDHVKIELEGMPPIVLQSISGWDSAREKYVAFEVSNMGGAGESTVHFAGHKVISTSTAMEDGAVVADHWVTEIGDDELSFLGHRSIDGGPLFVHVKGHSRRGGPGFRVEPGAAATVMVPPSAHMAPLQAMAGDWKFQGTWRPQLGLEAAEISGRETSQPILGGHALRSHVTGQGGGVDYEGLGLMAWCPAENCLMSVGCNNMGEYHASKCWVEGDDLLSVTAGAYMGRPTATRGILKMAPETLTITAHTAAGTDEPFLSFEGTWTRAGK